MLIRKIPNTLCPKGGIKMSTLETVKSKFISIAEKAALHDQEIVVRAACLTPEEAIGRPKRKDYPIIRGKEQMVEADFLGAKGQAFTDEPIAFSGTLQDILTLPLESNGNRALFISTLNAVLNHLGMVEGTVHCKNEEPEHCADEIAAHILRTHGKDVSIGLVGFNPAIAERLIGTFGNCHVAISDLFDGNIGATRFGVDIQDGSERVNALVSFADVLIVTGTTIGNDTFDAIRTAAENAGKAYYIFGVTGAGAAALTGINRLCFCSHRCR